MELSSTTRRLFEVEAARQRVATRKEAVYGIAATAIAFLWLVVVLDILADLPAWLRALITLLGPITLLAQVRKRLRESRQPDVRERELEHVAALLDRERPEAEGSLLAAVQLAKSPQVERGAAGRFVELALARAHALASEMLGTERPASAPPRIKRIVVSACAATLLFCLAFPRVVRFELPRFLLLWRDYPPLSLTDFRVTPGDIVVKAGADITLEARLSGKLPDSVDLVTHPAGGRAAAVALTPADGAIYRQRLQGVREDLVYYFRAETGRSRRYKITVHDPPEVRVARLIIRSRPGGKPLRTVELGHESVSVPRAAALELEIETNRAVRQGILRLTSAAGASRTVRLTVNRSRPDTARARFTLEHDTELQVALRATDGTANEAALASKVHVRSDTPPSVAIVEPGGNLLVAPGARVRLHAEAEDDFGVADLTLFLRRNGAARSQVSRVFSEPGTSGDVTHVLDLKTDGARVGDVYEVEAAARDASPLGPREARTSRFWVWVVSSEDLARLRARLTRPPSPLEIWPEAAAQTRLLAADQGRLAARADASANSAAAGSLAAAQGDLLARGRHLLGQYSVMANAETSGSVNLMLKRRAGQLAQELRAAIRGSMQVAARSPDGAARKEAMSAAARQLARIAASAQEGLAAIQAMQRATAMSSALEQVEAVTEEQRRIAERVHRAHRGINQPQAEQPSALASAQQANLRILQGYLAALREAATSLGYDAQAAGDAQTLLDAAAASRPGDPMARSLEALQAGRIAEAEEPAADAARRMAALRAVCRQCAQASLRAAAARAAAGLGRLSERDIQQAMRSMGGVPGAGGAAFQGTPRPGTRPGAFVPKIGANGYSIHIAGAAADGATSIGTGVAPNVKSEVGAHAVEVLPGAKEGLRTDRDVDWDPAYSQYRDLVNAYFQSLAGISREKR
jgi:hypothetical protein